MRPVIAAVVLAMVVATGACWYPDKNYLPADTPLVPDAPPGPYDCHNVGTPAPEQPTVTISGVVQIAQMGTALGGASVELFEGDAPVQTIVTPTTGKDMGAFSFQLATVGRPADIHLRVTDNNYITTLYYPAEFVTKNIVILPQMFNTAIAGYVAMKMGITLDMTNKVQFLIGAVDCQENALGGVTVMVSPQGDKVHYFVDNPNPMPDPNANVTDSATGAGVAANLPPQFINVSATYPSPSDGSPQTMFHHMIDAGGAAGTLIQTEIRP
jgi:hypothetical protein